MRSRHIAVPAEAYVRSRGAPDRSLRGLLAQCDNLLRAFLITKEEIGFAAPVGVKPRL